MTTIVTTKRVIESAMMVESVISSISLLLSKATIINCWKEER